MHVEQQNPSTLSLQYVYINLLFTVNFWVLSLISLISIVTTLLFYTDCILLSYKYACCTFVILQQQAFLFTHLLEAKISEVVLKRVPSYESTRVRPV